MSGLLDELAQRLLDADHADRIVQLAVAACHGDGELAKALVSTPDLRLDEPDRVRAPEAQVHLRAIRVTGFRGIGPTSSLDLPPGPGLTLVIGRNGSGKSSFAEAVELALTGDNRRWSKRSKVWRDGWRNLHHTSDAEVVGEFAVDGNPGPVTVRRHWPDGGGLDDAEVRVSGAADGKDLDALGWSHALDLYRPFLPYSELGAMVDDGPTALHDALSAVLGLDLLTAATKALQQARLQRERAWKAVLGDAKELAEELAAIPDPRGAEAADLLTAKAPDLDALEVLVGGGDHHADPGLDVLRQLATLPGPDLDAVRHGADRLDEASRAVRDARGTDAARDLEIADLLGRARRFHEDHGDADCPVCGQGTLDAEWAARVERLEELLHQGAAKVEALATALTAARREVAALCLPAPTIVHRASAGDVDADLVVQTWEALEAVTAEPNDLERAVQVRARSEAVANALTDLRARARTALAAREDHWRPSALRLAAWTHEARAVATDLQPVEELRAAERAVNQVLDQIRAERWTPIADQARAIWEQLRQASNVAIDDVALAGTGNSRRVEVSVTVDGVEGAALGVMSQGELHALALSLFLPRATLAESPFRFLVIDDPVQSMDPARVDGLARVLEEVARDRQVIVFTHDDRLPEAVRRLQVRANVLEVARARDSLVQVRHASSPTIRHLDDARALARSDGLPEIVQRRTVPGFCRLAIEAACADAIRRRDLAAGTSHAEVEDSLTATPKLLPRLALALFGDAARGGDVYGHLQRKVGGWAADLVRTCNEGTHQGTTTNLKQLVDEVDEMLRKTGLVPS